MFEVDAIFYKTINPGDLWNIDRAPGTVQGGGGQTYIDLAGIDDNELQEFLKYGTSEEKDNEERKKITINASKIGEPDVVSEITFDPRPKRPNYRITNQHRERHPAWRAENGFPTVPIAATGAASVNNIPNLCIFIVRTIERQYYAGYINSPIIPGEWPQDVGLEALFHGEKKGILWFSHKLPPIIEQIFDAWELSPNVLLYGPPGTGKTFAMQYVWKLLQVEQSEYSMSMNPYDQVTPFIDAEPNPIYVFKGRNRVEWLTFHQNFSYEEFVFSLRPKTSIETGFMLEPKLGVLMDVAVSVDPTLGDYDNGIIFIDELNRGNVSRIFGQFLTFLELDKRGWDEDGNENHMRLPVPLPQLQINVDKTEGVTLLNGNKIELPWPYYFPYPVFILASMNSVDRAVAPLDTALARRFYKIECAPDYSFLANYLNVDIQAISGKSREILTARETAYLLLKRVNDFLASVLGADFELGESCKSHS